MGEGAAKKEERARKKRGAELEKLQNGNTKNGVKQTDGVTKNGKVN